MIVLSRMVLSCMLAASLALAGLGCAAGQQPIPRVPPAPSRSLVEPLIERYEKARDSGEMEVPLEAYRQSVATSVKLWEISSLLAVELEQAQGLAGVDAREAAGREVELRLELDSARAARWYWGAGGIGIGLATALVIILVGP